MNHGQLSSNLPWPLAANKWATTINKVLAEPILSGLQIDDIVLTSGVTKQINHLLQRLPQGWFIVDQNAAASIFRAAPYNIYTLALQSSANVTISIWVY